MKTTSISLISLLYIFFCSNFVFAWDMSGNCVSPKKIITVTLKSRLDVDHTIATDINTNEQYIFELDRYIPEAEVQGEYAKFKENVIGKTVQITSEACNYQLSKGRERVNLITIGKNTIIKEVDDRNLANNKINDENKENKIKKFSMDTDIRKCKIKGFYPGMTMQETSSLNDNSKLRQVLIENYQNYDDLAILACKDKSSFISSLQEAQKIIAKESQEGISQMDLSKAYDARNKSYLLNNFLETGQSFEKICTSPVKEITISQLMSMALFENYDYTQKRFVDEFTKAYKINMSPIQTHENENEIIYRYEDDTNGCQIDIHQNLSITIKSFAKAGTAKF